MRDEVLRRGSEAAEHGADQGEMPAKMQDVVEAVQEGLAAGVDGGRAELPVGAEGDEVRERALRTARQLAAGRARELVLAAVDGCWKIAPQAAMPVAMPTWRKVELMPEAMPARRGSTTPTAAVASAGLTMPMPTPVTMKPAQQRRSSRRRP